MGRSIDLDNPRYRPMYSRPFGELCTRLRMENGEKINGVSCCYGLTSDKTDDIEAACKKCENYKIWN